MDQVNPLHLVYYRHSLVDLVEVYKLINKKLKEITQRYLEMLESVLNLIAYGKI